MKENFPRGNKILSLFSEVLGTELLSLERMLMVVKVPGHTGQRTTQIAGMVSLNIPDFCLEKSVLSPCSCRGVIPPLVLRMGLYWQNAIPLVTV